MEGTARERHCVECDRTVYDLSARTELEATALLLLLGSSGLCVRFSVDDDGAVQYGRAPRRPPSAPRATGMMAAAAIGVAACSASPSSAPIALAPPAPPPAVAEAPARPSPAAEPAPIVDSDNDGIPDAEDACPDEPGPRSDDPRKSGCPTIVGISQGEIVILEHVHFARGGRALDARGRAIVEAVAQVLQEHPDIKKVVVSGHASKDEHLAVRVGKARAEAVVDALRKRGIDPARLVVESYGDARPIADNATTAGRETNRRVQFALPEPTSPPRPGAGASP